MALLSLGDHGNAVRNLQRQLNAQGYKVDVDGEFGPKTDAAVRKFQSAHHLDDDGIVGRDTRAALRAAKGADTFEGPRPTQAPRRSESRGHRWRELQRFAEARGFHVTSTTGGHHLGAAHREGRAVDVRTRDHSRAQVDQFIREARAAGYTVFDERNGGNAAWSGPHVHIQVN